MGPVAELVLDRVGAIAPLLDEAMASAILQAEKRAHGLAHERYPHLRPLTIRADVREALMVESLPKGWHIDGDSRKMAQLILVAEESQGALHPAGSSAVCWCQPSSSRGVGPATSARCLRSEHISRC